MAGSEIFQTGFPNAPVPRPADVPLIAPQPTAPPILVRSEAVQVYPWWERPYQSSLNILPIAQGLVLAAGAGAMVQGPSIEVPNGYSWVIRGINIFAINTTANTNILYLLRFNQGILGNQYTTFGRVANSIEVPFPILEKGEGPGTLDVLIVNNNAFGPWTVGASFTGWFTPTVDARRVSGMNY